MAKELRVGIIGVSAAGAGRENPTCPPSRPSAAWSWAPWPPGLSRQRMQPQRPAGSAEPTATRRI